MNTNEKTSTKKFNRCKLDRHRLRLQRPLLLPPRLAPPLLLPVPPLPLGLPKTRENCNNFWNCNGISSQIVVILNLYFWENNERSFIPHWKRHFRAYQKLAKKRNQTIICKKVVCTSSSFSSSSSSSVDPTVSKVWREKSSMMTAAQKTWNDFIVL